MSIISLVVLALMKFQPLSIVLKFIFIMLWTYLLNFLCSKGYSVVSWVLVLLPIITFVSIILLSLDATAILVKQQQQQMQQTQQQQQQQQQQRPQY
jgi:heme exporter protein D